MVAIYRDGRRIKRPYIDPNGVSQLVVETSNGLERASIPNRLIPRNPKGQFNFRSGVYSRGYFERVGDGDWNALPWYQNPIDHLFVK